MTFLSFLSDILFVVVLFKERADQSRSLESLLGLIHENKLPIALFVYDNSPIANEICDDNVEYRHDPANSGVSRAYNEALQIAKREKKKWMLLLDQDTEIDQRHLIAFSKTVQQHSLAVAFVPKLHDINGLVSPFRWSFATGKRLKTIGNRLLLREYRFANSGLLIDTGAFSAAGGYEEKIPLDFSDISFGEKLQRVTDHFIVVDVDLEHALSASAKHTSTEAATRFHYFCLGAFEMGRLFGPFAIYYFRALMRGLHLSYRHKRAIFIKTFFSL